MGKINKEKLRALISDKPSGWLKKAKEYEILEKEIERLEAYLKDSNEHSEFISRAWLFEFEEYSQWEMFADRKGTEEKVRYDVGKEYMFSDKPNTYIVTSIVKPSDLIRIVKFKTKI